MGAPIEEWGETPSPGLMFYHTSTKEVPQTEPINNNTKKGNTRIMHMGNTILADAAEAGINENWCLLDNQSTRNTLVNGTYLSNIIYSPNGKYLRVHCNAGLA